MNQRFVRVVTGQHPHVIRGILQPAQHRLRLNVPCLEVGPDGRQMFAEIDVEDLRRRDVGIDGRFQHLEEHDAGRIVIFAFCFSNRQTPREE